MPSRERCARVEAPPPGGIFMRVHAIVAAAVAALFVQAGAGAAPRTINENDVQRLVTLGSPVVSGDGKTAVIEATRVLWNDDRRSSELVAVNLETGRQRALTYDRKGLSSPAFSPDGTR